MSLLLFYGHRFVGNRKLQVLFFSRKLYNALFRSEQKLVRFLIHGQDHTRTAFLNLCVRLQEIIDVFQTHIQGHFRYNLAVLASDNVMNGWFLSFFPIQAKTCTIFNTLTRSHPNFCSQSLRTLTGNY